MSIKTTIGLVLTAAFLTASANVSALPLYNLYFDRTDFLTHAGTVTTEDLNGYSDGDNLDGVALIPGLSVTTNMAQVLAWDPLATGDVNLFSLSRVGDEAIYTVEIDVPYNTVGFDIEAFDPSTPGPGVMEVFFTDGSGISTNIFPTNATEDDPLFFGVITDGAVDRLVWHEGPELTNGCCEETALDNFVVSRTGTVQVPAPAPLSLIAMGLALVAMGGRRWRSSSGG